MGADIRCVGVSKWFPGSGQVPVLDGVDLAVADGEFHVLIGPSGCGKSTLLYVLAGLEPPSAGQVFIGGEPVRGPSRRVGMVFQEFGLFDWMTVEANVGYGLAVRGAPRERRRQVARRLLGTMGLEEFTHYYPHQLSGGMKQRVAIARALAYEPDVLLMDEPFGALDAMTRRRLQQELAQLSREITKTVVFVTHSVREAVYLADRVTVIAARPGRVRAVVDVRLPRPRDAASPELARLEEELEGLLA